MAEIIMIRHILQILAVVFCCSFFSATTTCAQTYTVTDSAGNVLGDVVISPNSCAFRNTSGQIVWEAPRISPVGILPLVYQDAAGTTATINPPSGDATEGTWSVTYANGGGASGCLRN